MIGTDAIITETPEEKVKSTMLKFLQRKRNIHPNTGDGFLTTNTTADSETSGTDNNN